MKRFLYIVLLLLIRLINYLFPKDKCKILFDSFPDYSDNARALSDYIISEHKYDDYRIYWAVKSIPLILNTDRINFFTKEGKKGELQYIYHTMTAKYLFSTEGSFFFANPHTQKFICLWHGTPLKKIARLQNPNKIYFLYNCRCFISPSTFYQGIIANCFGHKKNEVIITGYPRNDLLFKPSNILGLLNIKKDEDIKLILYMPTFRQPLGGGYSDTSKNVFEDDFIRLSDKENILMWNTFFYKHNILFIIKPHPSDNNQIRSTSISNIIVLNNIDFAERDVQLYSLLYYTDALITDFSSVFCDYMLLNRPIGFLITDLQEYEKGRGFVFDNPIDYMPGVIIQSKDEFIDFCTRVVKGEDCESQKREKLFPIYNDYCDANSCKRVVEYVNL